MAADVDERHKQWARQWKNAGIELAAERRHELRAMSDSEGLAAAENLLSLVETISIDPARRDTSGLVRQQALFHRRVPA